MCDGDTLKVLDSLKNKILVCHEGISGTKMSSYGDVEIGGKDVTSITECTFQKSSGSQRGTHSVS